MSNMIKLLNTCRANAAAPALIAAALLSFSLSAAGAVSWIGGDGAWEDGAHWSGGVEPTAADDVSISHAGVVSSTDSLNEALSLTSDTSLLISSGVLDVMAVLTNLAAITADGGRLETNTLVNEGTGGVTVTGATGLLTVVLELDNLGAVTVDTQGTLSAPDVTNLGTIVVESAGRLDGETFVNDIGASTTVRNPGSTLSVTGNITNAGAFNALDAATATAASFVNYASLVVDDATFTVDSMFNAALGVVDLGGAATSFTVNGNITNQGWIKAATGAHGNIVSIGNESSIEVSGGAVLQIISVLNRASGTIDLRQAGSGIQLSDNLGNLGAVDISDSASLGALSIDNANSFVVKTGGMVDTESLLNLPTGTVTISDPGSRITLDNHFQNDGDVTVSDHGVISSASFVNRGNAAFGSAASLTTMTLINGPTGALTVNDPGSTLTVDGVLENRGALQITNNAFVSADAFGQFEGETVLDSGSLQSTGSATDISGGVLKGVGNIAGGLIVGPLGSIRPGTSIDPTKTLDVQGPVDLGGTLDIELLSTSIADFDRIASDAPVTLGGALNVTLLDGFAPLLGDTFDIILGLSVSGGFDSTLFPVFDGRTFTLVRGADFLRLQVASVPIPGAFYLLLSGVLLVLRRTARR